MRETNYSETEHRASVWEQRQCDAPTGGLPASQGRERQPSVAARNIWTTLYNKANMNMKGWLCWPNDIRGHLSYRWGKTPKKLYPGNLSRPWIEPGSAAWQTRKLQPAPEWWTIKSLKRLYSDKNLKSYLCNCMLRGFWVKGEWALMKKCASIIEVLSNNSVYKLQSSPGTYAEWNSTMLMLFQSCSELMQLVKLVKGFLS